ncbi:MAG: hypothetical protein DHS80DRAFT_23490 [Piptocephalis tieghemiana]|nr:MAG: hypothetical protein DHS80DRAFT_23490 [Piptocephalis tieghemiana]
MSKLTRSAKSGSEWTSNDLAAFNIHVETESDEQFFGCTLEDVDISDYPAGILASEPDRRHPEIYRLLKYLDLAMTIRESEESAVDDFAAHLFEALGYVDLERFVCTRKDIRLFMCGQNVYAKTDVCIMTENEILLLLQEDKSHINPVDPEPQLIAEAIAAFQNNNKVRERFLNVPPLPEYTFPCITMIGTYPTFYKITVDEQLSRDVQFGNYPSKQTLVRRFEPISGRRRHSFGMKPIDNRIRILKAFKAFRPFMQ